MIEIIGNFNTARVFATTLEDGAREQIKTVCDTEAFAASKIRIMPDVHAGKGCTIGTTMTVTNKIVPAMMGVTLRRWTRRLTSSLAAETFGRADRSDLT